ncbi:gliding motility-associated-like protein [Dyadobacter jejuensis]|uniref:Gliding motility-associated-like protein n=1 Tax=Dyadobacter jejuensis TaxID=1082580 RepID=A0A316A9B9_9BACT|nr:gliding motility-associated C-terminal domain-containing protein [Dyadobacter jejuensis]PWJ53590.1 gliding motility-associated-like protein [Dyadobacter jejuensis]
MEINQDFPCAEENDAVTLTAPDGFEKYLWNTGERSKTISVLHKTGERYFVNLTPFSSLSENCDLRLDYTIPSGLGTYINKVSICEGETYAVGDSVYRNTGVYLNRLSRPGQCDSLITTELTIIKLPETYKKITICEGDSLHVGNSTYQENGLYFNRIHQPDRCDSLVTTELTVTPLSRYTQELYICEGESIVVGNSTYKKSGTYINRLSRPNQCDSIVTTHLTVIYLKVAIPTSEQILFGDDLHVKPQIISNDTYTSLWSPNDGLNCYNCDSVLISPTASNTYTLLVQSKLSSCTATAAINIEVVPMCQLFTPDIFTPNQDSVNEIFFPIGGSCIRQILQFTIYNRWGEVIYVARNFPPSEASFGWTGHVKGKPASPGTYNYRIEFEYINTLRQLKSGDFLLVR